jgi:hypothetical protein
MSASGENAPPFSPLALHRTVWPTVSLSERLDSAMCIDCQVLDPCAHTHWFLLRKNQHAHACLVKLAKAIARFHTHKNARECTH